METLMSHVHYFGTQPGAEGLQYSKVANEFINVGPVRFAYRKVGRDNGVPLISTSFAPSSSAIFVSTLMTRETSQIT
jgi:hypothetical protein